MSPILDCMSRSIWCLCSIALLDLTKIQQLWITFVNTDILERQSISFVSSVEPGVNNLWHIPCNISSWRNQILDHDGSVRLRLIEFWWAVGLGRQHQKNRETASEKKLEKKNIWHVIGDTSHMFISNGGCIIDIPNWFLTSWWVNTVQTIRRGMTTTIKCSNWQNLFLAPPYSHIWLDINYYGNVYHAGWVIPIKFDHDDDDNTKDWIPFLVVHLLAFLPLSDLLSKILMMTKK